MILRRDLAAVNAVKTFGEVRPVLSIGGEVRVREPSVIIMSIKDYIKKIAPTPGAYQVIRQDAKSKGAASLSMREIDREIAAVRKQKTKKKK